MTTTKKIGLIALLASISCGAQAANFDYNYGQIGYETGDFAGLSLTGSFAINNEMFVIARYTALTLDVAGLETDYTDINLGAGYHMPINQKTDAVFTISFDSAEIDTPSQTIDLLPGLLPPVIIPGYTAEDTGILFTAGVRHNLNAKVELAGGVYHSTTFSGGSGVQGEARYNFNNKMSAGLSFTTGDYADGLGLNFRMGF